MPMNATQLAALVERAKQKPPPVVTPPPHRVVRPAQTASRSPARPTATAPVKSVQAVSKDRGKQPVAQPAVVVAPPPLPSPEPDDFPIGWELSKESWHFHRRFFRIFRRPMRRGEYSHLVGQIRHRKAERLWEDCWRVTLPWGRTLLVRGNGWRLITILPRDWQPPQRQPMVVSETATLPA